MQWMSLTAEGIKERISELEDRTTKMIKSEWQEENWLKVKEERLRDQ